MRKINIIGFVVAMAISANGFAQLETPLAQYSGNQIVFNPGSAGLYDVFSLNLSIHQSWVGLPGAPQRINFNGHAPFENDKHAWGWVFQREKWGPLTGNFVYGNYAYKILMRQGILSLGLQAGFLNHVVNWDEIDHRLVEDPTDPAYRPNDESRTASTKFDANFGAYFLAPQYFVGLSAHHLTHPKYDEMEILYENGFTEDWYSQVRTQFLLMGGYRHQFDDVWSLCPELFLRYVHNVPLSVNVGAHAYYNDVYSLGVNFMSGQKAVSLCAKVLLFDKLRVGYSYSIFYGPIQPFQRGSHEISLNYRMKELWKSENVSEWMWL